MKISAALVFVVSTSLAVATPTPRAPCNGPGQPACPLTVKRCGGVSVFGVCVGRRYDSPPPARKCVSNFQGVCITKRHPEEEVVVV